MLPAISQFRVESKFIALSTLFDHKYCTTKESNVNPPVLWMSPDKPPPPTWRKDAIGPLKKREQQKEFMNMKN